MDFKKEYPKWFSDYQEECQTLLKQCSDAQENLNNLDRTILRLWHDEAEEWQTKIRTIIYSVRTLHRKIESSAESILETILEFDKEVKKFDEKNQIAFLVSCECHMLLNKNENCIIKLGYDLLNIINEKMLRLEKECENFCNLKTFPLQLFANKEKRYKEKLTLAMTCIKNDYADICYTQDQIEIKQHILQREFTLFAKCK